MHAQKSTSSTMVILTGVVVAFVVTACDSVPTAPEEHLPAMAAMSNNSQTRVPLCHRTTTGDYVKITVADAAYDTHMAHGDRDVGQYGECQIIETSRLDVENWGWSPTDPWNDIVIVTVLAFGGAPDTQLPDCSGSCSYDVPTGATVSLSGVPEFTWLANVDWSECSAYPAQQATVTCVVDRNMAASVGPAY